MSKYKVLVEVEVDGKTHVVGSEVELTKEVAAPLVDAGKVEAVE